MERDRYGYVEFVDIKSVHVLFNEKPLFSELVARARKELHCHGDDGITVEGVLHLGFAPNIFRKMIPIGCVDQWENYVRSAMWGIDPRVPQDGTWAAPSEVARPVRSRRAHQDYKLY